MPDPADVARHRGEPDPNLQCNERMVHFYHDGFLGGYDRNNSDILRRLQGYGIDWRLRDYGCYTGYSVHGNGILWTVLQAEQFNSYLRPMIGVDPVTGRALDLTSTKLTYMYHAHEQYHDNRLIGFLPAIAGMMMHQHGKTVREQYLGGHADVLDGIADTVAPTTTARTLQQKPPRGSNANRPGMPPPPMPRQHRGLGKRYGDERYSLPQALGKLSVIEGHALVVPMQHERFVCQAMILQLNTIARFWATGALLETNGTIVTPEPRNAVMKGVMTWMFPLLPNPVHHVRMGDVVYMPHSHYVTPSSYEHPDPCSRKFLRDYLLPRAIAAVRRDREFKFGDDTKRLDKAVSDWEWAQTLPKMIAVVKSKGQSREPTRAFALDDRSRAMFREAGYLLLSDSSSLLHRFVLVNFADVAAVTFGSLLLMMSQIYCRDDLPAAEQIRFVTIVQQGYHGEEFLFSPVYHREGVQDGARVIVTNFSVFNPPHMWFKHVMLMGEQFTGKLTLNHLRFDRAEATLGNRTDGKPHDFPSRFVGRNTVGGDKRKWQLPASFVDIPGMGQCFRDGTSRLSSGGWMPHLSRA